MAPNCNIASLTPGPTLIFFPIRENLYWRYGSSDDKPMGAYYLSKCARIPPSFAEGMNGLPSPLGGEG